MTDQTQGADAGAGGGTPDAGGGGVPSAAEIMAFDPFAPAEAPAKDSEVKPAAGTSPPPKPADAPVAGSVGADGKTPVPAQLGPDGKTPVQTPPPAPAPTPATTPTANTAELERLIREQTAAITQAVQKPQAAESQGDNEQPQAKYNLALPPQVLGLLRSEDPGEFQQGMHAVINGISNKLWQDVNEHIEARVQAVLQQVPQFVEQHTAATTTKEKVAQDFYGAHASLNIPALRPIVQQVGLIVAQRRQAAGKDLAWSPELRDEIAEEVYTQLPQLRPAGSVPAAATVPAGGKSPPFAAGGGSRPAPAQPNEFAELLQ